MCMSFPSANDFLETEQKQKAKEVSGGGADRSWGNTA